MHEAARREKLARLVELGVDPWGGRFDGQIAIGRIRARESEITTQPGAAEGKAIQHGPRVRAAGRIVLQRKKGKLIFLDIRDWTGQIQVMIGRAQVGEAAWAVAECFDLGDLIGVDGEFKRTNTGELTIFADTLHFLSKSIEPHPDKYKGLSDPELRQRQRYLDLIHSDGVLTRFLTRTRIVERIRETMNARGFVEVEGPVLHILAGGAAARPFRTHHQALGMPLFLRIALELHLKRLLVGGIERVYELGRVFRNEGISPRHNPEFTMLEAYQAYGDYTTMMELTEALVVAAADAAGHAGTFECAGPTISVAPPFARRAYDDLLAEHAGVAPDDATGLAELARRHGYEPTDKHPDLVKNFVFEELVERHLVGPVFVVDYPASICPLTPRKAGRPNVAERFELFLNGMELANAYTELNDPDLQEQLFRTQLAGQSEEESMARFDQDFIRALRYGMPPAGGLGLGIDRLVMLLTGSTSIRDVILFPLLRPEAPRGS
jgi:lysyl-tRNA synthetase class 2